MASLVLKEIEMINYTDYSNDKAETVSDEFEVEETVLEEESLPDSDVPELDDQPICVVNAPEVYIRSDAGKDSTPVTTVKSGTELLILSEHSNDWYEVMLASGVEGYIMRQFVSVKE